MTHTRISLRSLVVTSLFLVVVVGTLVPANLAVQVQDRASTKDPSDPSVPAGASTAPNSAGWAPLTPSLLPLSSEFTQYLLDGFAWAGGFPTTGASLEDTLAALELLEVVRVVNQTYYDPEAIKAIVVDRQQSNGGFKETIDDNATITASYDAVRILESINRTLTVAQEANLLDFVNQTLRNATYFSNQNGTLPTDPIVLGKAIYVLNYLNATYLPQWLVANQTYDYLVREFFHPEVDSIHYGFFTTAANERKYEATYFALQALDALEKLNQTRVGRHDYSVDVTTGEALAGSAVSMHEAGDGEIFLVNSTPAGLMELVFEVSTEKIFEWEEETFGFLLCGNLSTVLDTEGSASIWNVNTSQWEKITTTLALASASGAPYPVLNFSAANRDVLNYTYEAGGFPRSIKVKLNFQHSSNFTLAVDQFLHYYTVFDERDVGTMVADSFQVSNWDTQDLLENYYAIRVMDYLDSAQAYLHPDDWVRMAAFVVTFEQAGGYRPRYSKPVATLPGTHAAYYMLNYMGYNSLALTEQVLEYLAGWQFPDGGFGSHRQLSLVATYRVAKILNDTGHLSDSLKLNISRYVQATKVNGTNFWNDQDPELTQLGDTVHAIYLADMIGNASLLADLQDIAATTLAAQTPAGYFWGEKDLSDVYFACYILYRAGAVTNMTYIDSLRTYVKSLQLYHGGFLMNPYRSLATVEATCYGTRVARMVDFLDLIQLWTVEESQRGVVDYFRNHQHPLAGGIYEENLDFLFEDQYVPSNEMSALTLQTLSEIYLVKYLNATGIEAYVYGQMASVNDLTPLHTTHRVTFHEVVTDRAFVVSAYVALEAAHLHLNVYHDYEKAIPNTVLPLSVLVTDPQDGHTVEDCEIFVLANNTAFWFEDQQNGSYVVNILPYNVSDTYSIVLYCDHDDYLGFFMTYELQINDPLERDRLQATSRASAWFSHVADIKVPVFNETNGQFAPGCNVTLWDEQGNLVCTLTEHPNASAYQCNLEYSPWWISSTTYTVRVEGPLFRTEAYQMRVLVVPVFFIIVVIAILVVSVTFIVVRVKKHRRSVLLVRFRMGEQLSEKDQAKAKQYIEEEKKAAEEAAREIEEEAKKAKEKAEKARAKAREKALKAKEKAREIVKKNQEKAEKARAKQKKKAEKAQEALKKARSAKRDTSQMKHMSDKRFLEDGAEIKKEDKIVEKLEKKAQKEAEKQRELDQKAKELWEKQREKEKKALEKARQQEKEQREKARALKREKKTKDLDEKKKISKKTEATKDKLEDAREKAAKKLAKKKEKHAKKVAKMKKKAEELKKKGGEK